MRLQQNQTWRQGDEFIRIVRLERVAVDYKVMKDLTTKEGKHLHATKKEFCRLLKGAVLLPPPAAQSAAGAPPLTEKAVAAMECRPEGRRRAPAAEQTARGVAEPDAPGLQ